MVLPMDQSFDADTAANRTEGALNMRKVILVNATLDGYIAGPNGELDWMMADPA
jgi:hypothetical protein